MAEKTSKDLLGKYKTEGKSAFDFSELTAEVVKELGEGAGVVIGTADILGDISDNPEDYITMPDWWQEAYGVPGLQFDRIVQYAGDTNSGKTTISMQAIKCAQDQGHGVIYVETEGKTPTNKFLKWGIDPKGVMTASSKITEQAFDASFALLDKFKANFPNNKLLFVFDSYGNTTSIKEKDNTLTKEARVGGTAKINRRAMNILLARIQEMSGVAVLIVNYTYDNIGSVGKTNAGGKALDFFCTLIVQTTRTGWVDKTVKGVKGRGGAKFKWTTTKNHWADCLANTHFPKAIEMRMTDDGLERIG